MHILILNFKDPKNSKAGGAEIVTMQHAVSWIHAGHNVTWFTSSFPRAKAEEVLDNVHIVRKGNLLTTYFLAPIFYLFSGEKFDLVIDEIHGIPYATPVYVRKPKIAFIHEVAGDIWDYMYPFPLSTLGKFLENFYFLFYKHIFFWTDAESTVDELVGKGIARKHCSVIHCPVTNTVLTELPKKEKELTCLFVSRLVPMKGVERVIEAFAQVVEEYPSAKLRIVGAGDKKYTQKLQTLVHDKKVEKHIVFLGKISEKEKLSRMKRAHILLHASVKEGWGLVVTEAASQATPAIVYNVPGLRDSVIQGKTGVILNQNTPQVMAKAIVGLWKDTKGYRNMQKQCLLWASSLSLQKCTARSLQLIENAVR